MNNDKVAIENKEVSDRKENTNGRLTTQISDLQKRIENFSEESSWIPPWKSRLKRFSAQQINTTSAATSYYLLFSIFPLILFVFSLLEILDPGLAARFESAIPSLSPVIPEVVLDVLQNFLGSIGQTSSIPMISATAIGLLWAASRGVGNIVSSLNRIYHSDSRVNFLLRRLIGIVSIVIAGVLLAVILLILAFNRLLINFLRGFITLPDFILQDRFNIFANLAAFVLLTLVFTIVFTLIKRTRSYLRHTLISASLTALGWIVVSYLMSYFISVQTKYYLMYGSIAGIVFLMLWLYMVVYILLAGAFVHSELILSYPRPPKEKRDKKRKEN